ncbi:hypothetical protein [Marinibacterium sp. SX1]|uniref:hypothetical protein n=1 Tax=Marinibacterium sp. SX1 TaxID=3388424 RepID=UPI003D178841
MSERDDRPARRGWRGLALACATVLVPGIGLGFGLGLARPAEAQVPVTYTEAGRALFTFDAPDFWTLRSGGDRLVADPETDVARPVARIIGLQPTADDHVWVGFIVPRGVTTMDQAADYLRDIGPHLVRDPVMTGRTAARVGGLDAMRFTGSGRRNGRGVAFTAVTIELPGPRVAVSVTVIEDGADPAWLGPVNEIYGSFRAAR